MRYKDFKNGKPYKSVEYKEEVNANVIDPIVESLKEKINRYNFLEEVMQSQKI